ncbi:Diuretic hormone class 2, partial [Stegodyphus mimosarum]
LIYTRMSNTLFTTAFFLCILVSTLNYTWSYPANNNLALNSRSKRSTDIESPEEIVRILLKLAETVPSSYYMIPNEKRGIDLGLSRGFSGSQAAKHLMGLQAANFANGPGRRRRDIESQ